MTTPLITVDRIAVRRRDRWLLDGASWRINAGEQWMVTGPNGAGKSTLVQAIAGLLPVVKGKIHYHGFDGRTPMEAIAYVAGDTRRDIWRREAELNHQRGFAGRFNDATTVGELIGGGPSVGCRSEEMDARLEGVVGRFHLGSLLDKPVAAVSTGEMSRVLIAREMIRHPRILILDEPFEGLDGTGRLELIATINRMAAMGLPIVLISHRLEERLPAITHLLALDQGRIVSAKPISRSHALNRLATTRPISTQRVPFKGGNTGLPRQPRGPISTKPLIDMQAVTVRYGDTVVLDRLDWTVAAGEHWALSGPNGAGKSTVLKLITGECLQVYGNRVRLFGRDRGTDQNLWEIRERLGVVSHDLSSAYQKRLSALDVVCSGFFDSVGLYRHCDPGQVETARRWLVRLKVPALADTAFNRLSQGQRQMVLIARAMVKSPRLLILDEPCAGLDPTNRGRVLDLVDDIGISGTTQLLFISHHEQEIPACTTHRLFLDQGIVMHSGPIGSYTIDPQGRVLAPSAMPSA